MELSFSELDTTAERIELRWKLFSFGQVEFDLPFKNSSVEAILSVDR